MSGMGIASVLIPDDLAVAAISSAESLPILESKTLTRGLFLMEIFSPVDVFLI
ncbi:hypothetical protein SMITH_300 [Smithella sp. ME-1]|nr:hypothetical protein SMITH_300 [Smithella sp. ME-1]